jgi:uncharacterized protein HemX
LSIASQQLQVGGSVQGALVALQDAETALRRGNAASVGTLRRLIARDIDRLRAVPITDVGALAARLDNVVVGVDQYPLRSDAAIPDIAPAAIVPEDPHQSAIDRLAHSGLRGWNALRVEFQSLIRVNRVDTPDALLLAPEQRYFARENLRLRLLAARLALLSRNDPVFKSDLTRAIEWLGTYYDRDHRSVSSALATLRQLRASRVSVDLPSLAESLAAARAMRAARESAR